MKKIFIFTVLTVLSAYLLTISAQNKFVLGDGSHSFVYSLPKTELCFEIEVETQSEKPGVFYQYSQRYLATNKVVTEEKTAVRVLNIQMKQLAIPDPSRRYAVEIQSKQFNPIIVNEKGILCGVNTAIPALSSSSKEKGFIPLELRNSNEIPALLPLTQEYMMAGSIAKMAEGAAIQIYNIRMSRLNLLSGEVDIMPDGEALKLMLTELDKKEKELTELFVGTINKTVKIYTVYFTPDFAVSNDILFRLSALRGVVSNDDLSGSPYYITVKPEQISTKAQDPKAKVEETGLYTVLPANTEITVTDGVNTLYQQSVQIPQLGKLVTLPVSVLQNSKVKITVDPMTGRLLGIEK